MNIAVIFAGGVGKRMNSFATPKQFLKLHGKEIIIYTLEKFNECPDIDAITIACIEDWIPYLKYCIKQYGIHKVKSIVPGGRDGQESIYNALKAANSFADDKSIVLVHDGVRPLIDVKTITANIQCVQQHGNAITVAPAIETIIQIDEARQKGDKIKSITDRSCCFLARAPQSFYLDDLLSAHENAVREQKRDFIDSASLMKHYGWDLFIVNGPNENIKITTPADYYAFKAYYEANENSEIFGAVQYE